MRSRAQRRLPTLAEKATQRLGKSDLAGVRPDDVMGQARATLLSIARGHGGPRAWERLLAAQRVLAADQPSMFTDDQLLLELKHRTALLEGCSGHCHCGRRGVPERP